MKYRIYVDKHLCAVEEHDFKDVFEMEQYVYEWAQERLIDHANVEIKRWAGT